MVCMHRRHTLVGIVHTSPSLAPRRAAHIKVMLDLPCLLADDALWSFWLDMNW